MISADFIDSRNSPSSHGKWLRSLQRWTAAFCRLNNASSCSQARLLLACEMHTPRSRLMLTTTKIPLMVLLHRRFQQLRNNASGNRWEEHTSELQSRLHLVCRLLLE